MYLSEKTKSVDCFANLTKNKFSGIERRRV